MAAPVGGGTEALAALEHQVVHGDPVQAVARVGGCADRAEAGQLGAQPGVHGRDGQRLLLGRRLGRLVGPQVVGEGPVVDLDPGADEGRVVAVDDVGVGLLMCEPPVQLLMVVVLGDGRAAGAEVVQGLFEPSTAGEGHREPDGRQGGDPLPPERRDREQQAAEGQPVAGPSTPGPVGPDQPGRHEHQRDGQFQQPDPHQQVERLRSVDVP